MSRRDADDTLQAAFISYRRRRQLKRWFQHGLLLVAMILILFPIYWALSTSLRDVSSLQGEHVALFSADFTLEHYRFLLTETPFLTWLGNSLLVAAGVMVLTVVFATLGGYGLARLNLTYKRTFARGVLLGYMFPPILLAIPMYIIWQRIGILNSHIGLILAETALALPFSLWLMWNFFQSVPYSLEESAQMNGASRFQAFVDIALPMARPGIIAILVFAFAVSWNEYTLAQILMSDRSKFVVTIGLDQLVYDNLVPWGPMMGAAFITIVPTFLLVYFLQKYLIRGFRITG